MPMREQSLDKFHPLVVDMPGGGFVQLCSVFGSDAGVDTVARVDDDESPRMPDKVDSLLCYMIRHQHTSPFEFASMTFFVRPPLFVRAQWMRHRTGHYSEVSGRYRDVSDLGAYCPPEHHLRKTAPSRKQGSSDELVEDPGEVISRISQHYESGQELYRWLLDDVGLSKEIARGVLLQNNFTEFYFQMDLHNLLNFLRLRTHATAQFQTSEYANAIRHFISQAFPITYSKYRNHVLDAVRFSADELEVLGIDDDRLKEAKNRLSSGRYTELMEKVSRIYASKEAKTHH